MRVSASWDPPPARDPGLSKYLPGARELIAHFLRFGRAFLYCSLYQPESYTIISWVEGDEIWTSMRSRFFVRAHAQLISPVPAYGSARADPTLNLRLKCGAAQSRTLNKTHQKTWSAVASASGKSSRYITSASRSGNNPVLSQFIQTVSKCRGC